MTELRNNGKFNRMRDNPNLVKAGLSENAPYMDIILTKIGVYLHF